MSDDNKLPSFTAGSMQQAPLGAKGPVKPKERQQDVSSKPEASLGFSRIESILDNEDPAVVLNKLEALRSALTDLETNGAKAEQAAAQKAALAVDHTRALLGYLFQTKQAMIDQHAKVSK